MWLEAVEITSGHTSPMHGTVATQVTNGYEIYNFLVDFYHFFEEFLSPRIFPNGLESATFESVIFALLPFLDYNSIHTISMQNNIKIKLTYIAR